MRINLMLNINTNWKIFLLINSFLRLFIESTLFNTMQYYVNAILCQCNIMSMKCYVMPMLCYINEMISTFVRWDKKLHRKMRRIKFILGNIINDKNFREKYFNTSSNWYWLDVECKYLSIEHDATWILWIGMRLRKLLLNFCWIKKNWRFITFQDFRIRWFIKF